MNINDLEIAKIASKVSIEKCIGTCPIVGDNVAKVTLIPHEI